jgi:hypothetical protein
MLHSVQRFLAIMYSLRSYFFTLRRYFKEKHEIQMKIVVQSYMVI